MHVLQNFDRRSIKTCVPNKHTRIHDELVSGVSCDPKDITLPIYDVLEVLVVDGNHENGQANAELMRRLGHKASLADDGHKGLRMAAETRPDVVLLNIDLSFLDGYQVANHLRVDFPTDNILIIGVATNAHKALRQRCVQAGIDLVLEAPINEDIIEILLLLECVRLHRLRTDFTKQAKNDFRKVDMRVPSSVWPAWRSFTESQVNSYLVS